MRIFGQNRGYAAGALIVGVGLLGSILMVVTGPSANPVEQFEKAWPVSTMVAHPEALAPRFSTFARVESNQVANLRSTVDAPVSQVLARVGDHVHADQILIRLADAEAQLALRERRAELAATQAELASLGTEQARLASETQHQQQLAEIAVNKLARYESLLADGMVAQSLFDEVRREASERSISLARHQADLDDIPNRIKLFAARVEQAATRADQASLDIERTVIRAPFAGPVLEISAGPGDQFRGMPLLMMADINGFELKAPIPARYGDRIRAQLARGQSITASSHGPEGVTNFPLLRIGGAIRSGQSGLDGFFAVPPEIASRLEIGRVLDLEVEMPPEHNVIALPVPALFENDHVYRIQDNRLQAVTVDRIGEFRANGEFAILVRSPQLHTGEVLLTTQLPNAISGLLVETQGHAGLGLDDTGS